MNLICADISPGCEARRRQLLAVRRNFQLSFANGMRLAVGRHDGDDEFKSGWFGRVIPYRDASLHFNMVSDRPWWHNGHARCVRMTACGTGNVSDFIRRARRSFNNASREEEGMNSSEQSFRVALHNRLYALKSEINHDNWSKGCIMMRL